MGVSDSARTPTGEPLVPEDLCFDDAQPESLLGKLTPSPRTPADVLKMWEGHFDRSDDVARAIATILCRDERYASEFAGVDGIEQCLRDALDSSAQNWTETDPRRAACLAALGLTAQIHGRTEEAEGFLRQAFELQKNHLGSGHPDTRATTKRLAALLEQIGRVEEAKRLQSSLDIDMLLREGQRGETLRSKALELFLEGRYEEAQDIYRHMVRIGFELSSTHCHLARVCLITNREREAAQEAARAWDNRHQASPYVVPRILFLRLVIAILADEPIDALLAQLDRALREPGASHTWTMKPVVEHFRLRLAEEHLTLLTALVEALSEPDQVRRLDEVALWRAATAESSDERADRPPMGPDSGQ